MELKIGYSMRNLTIEYLLIYFKMDLDIRTSS